MEEIEYCHGQLPEGCGARLTPRWLNYSAYHLLGMRYLIEEHHPEPMPLGELGRFFGLGSASSIYQAFHENRWFGLAVHPIGPDGAEVFGEWLATKRGLWFHEGVHEIPKKVRVFRGEVVEESEATIGIEAVPYIKMDRDFAIAQMTTASLEDIARALEARRRRHIKSRRKDEE